MNSDTFIKKLGADLAPLSSLLARRADDDIVIRSSNVQISHRPAIGPEAYAVTLHAPLSDSEVEAYERTQALSIPFHYASVLRSINGAHIFGLALYGIPGSTLGSPPLLDRSSRQPLDLATANRFWRAEFQSAPDLFHFGSGAISFNENVGYFIDASGGVVALRKNALRWNQWPTFTKFLSAEIDRFEREFPAFEAFMADTIRPAR